MEMREGVRWHKSKGFYVPALLMTGMIMGSALTSTTSENTHGTTVEKEVKATITDKVTVPTAIPTQGISVAPTKMIAPTRIPTKYIVPTAKPTVYVAPTTSKVQSGGGMSCNCSLTCTQMTSCAEAQYQLNSCGCSARDADNDGTACDSGPLHCQN